MDDNQADHRFIEFFPELLEEGGHCVMVPLSEASELLEYIARLPDHIIYETDDHEHGKEHMPHITVLYGIKPIEEEKTKSLLSRMPKNMVASLGTVSLFETNPEFDVLKIDVESPHLHRINEFLCKEVEYNNAYPQYHPHVTLAYLKKGTGKPYVGDKTFAGKKFRFETFIYANENRKHDKIPMKEVSIMTGMGGGYGGQAGGPLAGSWGVPFSSPSISGPRMTTRKTQNFPDKAGRSQTMQGNTVVNSGLYDTIVPEDLKDPRFKPEEIRQGIRMEMKKMEYPDKELARRLAIKHLEKNPKYYSDLHMYFDTEG